MTRGGSSGSIAVMVGTAGASGSGMATVKFGRFVGSGEFATASVLKDGVQVGSVTRVKRDDFVTESIRERKWVVSEYEVDLDSEEDSKTFAVTSSVSAVEALKQAKGYCREKCRIGDRYLTPKGVVVVRPRCSVASDVVWVQLEGAEEDPWGDTWFPLNVNALTKRLK